MHDSLGDAMPNPFPGMNPYLERRTFWPGFYGRYVIELADQLNPSLTDDFVANASEEIKHYPDGEQTRDFFVEITRLSDPADVKTAIMMPSPRHKVGGIGYEAYATRRESYLNGGVNLVEIDLLRCGERCLAVPEEILSKSEIPPSDYLVCIHRTEHPCRFELYPLTLRMPLPKITIPIGWPYADLVLDLQRPMDGIYDRGRFAVQINYQNPLPPPAISADDEQWVDTLLKSRGLRH